MLRFHGDHGWVSWVQTFTVRCLAELATLFEAGADEAADAERAWVTGRREALRAQADLQGWSTAQLSQARRVLAVEHAEARAVGELRGTRGLVVLPALRAQFGERRWTGRRFKPVPAAGRLGRPWGATDRTYPARLVLQLPDADAELLVRGCYWTSLPHVRGLQAFYDRHGDHWRGERHEGRLGRRLTPGDEHLRTRAGLVARIVTTGLVLRQALAATVGRPDLAEPAKSPSPQDQNSG